MKARCPFARRNRRIISGYVYYTSLVFYHKKFCENIYFLDEIHNTGDMCVILLLILVRLTRGGTYNHAVMMIFWTGARNLKFINTNSSFLITLPWLNFTKQILFEFPMQRFSSEPGFLFWFLLWKKIVRRWNFLIVCSFKWTVTHKTWDLRLNRSSVDSTVKVLCPSSKSRCFSWICIVALNHQSKTFQHKSRNLTARAGYALVIRCFVLTIVGL
jgi:hypothetical protein